MNAQPEYEQIYLQGQRRWEQAKFGPLGIPHEYGAGDSSQGRAVASDQTDQMPDAQLAHIPKHPYTEGGCGGSKTLQIPING